MNRKTLVAAAFALAGLVAPSALAASSVYPTVSVVAKNLTTYENTWLATATTPAPIFTYGHTTCVKTGFTTPTPAPGVYSCAAEHVLSGGRIEGIGVHTVYAVWAVKATKITNGAYRMSVSYATSYCPPAGFCVTDTAENVAPLNSPGQ